MPVPDFAVGEVLTSAAMDSIGLWLVKTQTISSSPAVPSVTVTDAFSADYDNYKIILSGGVGSTTQTLLMTLGATTSGYYWAIQGATFVGVAAPNGAENTSSWRAGGGSTLTLSSSLEIYNPFNAERTVFNGAYQLNTTSGGVMLNTGGFLNNTTSYTAFTLTPTSGTLSGGTIRVYGYRK
jgi:hypothetical protein